MSGPHGDTCLGMFVLCIYTLSSCSWATTTHLQAIPCLIMPRSQEPLFCSYDPQPEPCVLLSEQGKDLMERHNSYREYLPRAPPPSPTKLTSFTCTEPNEASKYTFCALHLVDREIEVHQSRMSPILHRRAPRPYSPARWTHDMSGQKLKCVDEPMHKTAPMHQVSLAPDDDDEMTVTNSRCYSLTSSGTNTLVNDHPGGREVDCYSGVHTQRTTTSLLKSRSQLSPSKSPNFCPFNLRSCQEAIADVPSTFRFPSSSSETSRPRPSITGRHISSPRPVGSSAISDIAASPPEYKHTKTKSWPGPCRSLPAADSVSIPKATTASRQRKCDFACACYRERTTSFDDGGMPNASKCLPGSETCPSMKYSLNLEPLAEHVRAEEVIAEEQAVPVEEERSHFSDCSTDEDEDGEKMPVNARLFNSLGRLNRRSKIRVSWGNIFFKP